MVLELSAAIVKGDVKTAGHSNQQLMQFFMCMATAIRTTGHIVEVVDSPNIKRYVYPPLDKGKITSWIFYFW